MLWIYESYNESGKWFDTHDNPVDPRLADALNAHLDGRTDGIVELVVDYDTTRTLRERETNYDEYAATVDAVTAHWTGDDGSTVSVPFDPAGRDVVHDLFDDELRERGAVELVSAYL